MTYIRILDVPHSYKLTPSSTVSSGCPLVFLHGWLLSQHYWQPVIDSLAEEFQCLRYDMRGFGESNQELSGRSPCQDANGEQDSTAPYSPYSLAAYAQDLGHLLQALELEPAWLVGHSLGGSVALWAAKLFPERVRGVICVNAGGGVYLPEEFSRFRQAGRQIIRWRPGWLKSVPFIECAFANLMVQKPLALHWGEQRVADLLAADREAAIGVLLESTTEAEVHRLPQVVASLTQPVHFIAGAEDTVMAEKYVRHLASFHPSFDSPSGNVTVLPDCGHMAMLEQPIALAHTIRSFIMTGVPSSREAFESQAAR